MKKVAEVIGKSLFFASLQLAIGSIELGSKYIIPRLVKDQDSMDLAMNGLKDYMIIAIIWTISVSLILYSSYGKYGLVCGIISNIVVTCWLYNGYMKSLRLAGKKNNLVLGSLF